MSNADTHRELHDLFNGRDLDALAKRLAESFSYHDRPRNLTLDGEEFIAWLGEWISSLDGRCTQSTYLDAGDTSVARFVGSGVNNGPMGPFPPTGRSVQFPVCELLTYDADGNVTGGEIYYDQVTILSQLGHIDLPG